MSENKKTNGTVEKESLLELLQSNTKDVMLEIAAKHEADVPKSYTKAKIAERMVPTMVADFSTLLETIGQTEWATIDKIIHQKKETPFTDEDAKFISLLAESGYLYIEDQDHFEPFLPVDMTDCIEKFDRSTNLQGEVQQNQKLVDYATSLIHLYGVYPIAQLTFVWNEYHHDKKTDEEIINELKPMLKWQTEYALEEGIMYSTLFQSMEEVKTVLDRLHAIPYYMPTEKELAYYAENTINIDSPHYLNLKNYFDSKPLVESVKAEAVYAIAYGSVIGTSGKSIDQILQQLGVSFDSKKEASEFLAIYKELDDTTRKWDRHGFMPIEMRTEKKQHNKKPNQPITVHKIGRNEPCPCGSGKKYKKCHGR